MMILSTTAQQHALLPASCIMALSPMPGMRHTSRAGSTVPCIE